MHQSYLINIPKCDLSYVSFTKLNDSFQTISHSHDVLELIYIEEGEGQIITRNRNIEIKKGDIILINPNSEHCEVSKYVSFYALGIKNSNAYLPSTFTKKIIKIKENNSHLSSLFYTILEEAKNKQKGFESIIKNTFENIQTLSDRMASISFNQVKTKKESSIANEIKTIIDNFYYLEDLNLFEIAHRLSLSISSISHLFKKEFNKTIITYKLEVQIKEAKNLLLENNMSIKQVASLVGFKDESYFSKTFKKYLKLTPEQYRIKNLK